ncbi:MAG TPA: succinyl-diaminopimelate desuccinylase [Xanthobacteraceae bacterium]|jgi:succinyl-diaminopimelate desuccinylase|nr:succinyl-diaminopimelate desuccinylase [Xanthobacteraceae bacterium]
MNDPIAIAQALIRCRSVTPDEGGALDYLGDLLGRAGFEVHRQKFASPGFPEIDNLFAKIGSGRPHLVFAGHTDVVPPGREANWSEPPFGGVLKDGKLYGRGATDMKGAVAAFAAAALDFTAGKKLKGTISFLITGDEEGPAVNGTVKLLSWAKARGERFSHALVGEPTSISKLGDMMKIGRRGSLCGTITVRGKQGHVAYPDRASNPVPVLIAMCAALKDKPYDKGSKEFQPSNLEVVSLETGNTAFNVIPAEVKARFNIRFNDKHTPAKLKKEIEQRLKKAAKGARFTVEWEPASESYLTQRGPFVDLVSKAVLETTGVKTVVSTSGGTSDARFIKNYCPVIDLGLVGTTMHQVDENVPVKDLEKLTKIYRAILERYFAAKR